ncbi:hypothetical protein CTI12_AA523950 [Artemisia annua]|uniref:Uncharacterized protein n=1 Tax=Artemisia annua TaxID=35608 RepID=A0A2U1L6X0_ARTAN|nr:hypothetical protein CTI12_AA523950 [Artemisia annua]
MVGLMARFLDVACKLEKVVAIFLGVACKLELVEEVLDAAYRLEWLALGCWSGLAWLWLGLWLGVVWAGLLARLWLGLGLC